MSQALGKEKERLYQGFMKPADLLTGGLWLPILLLRFQIGSMDDVDERS